jgi:hypothetical protein
VAYGDGQFIYTASSNTTARTVGSLYVNTTTNATYINTGTHWAPMTTYTTPSTTFVWNGDPNMALNGSQIFKSMEERVDYQQKAYQEPRDHAYNPGPNRACQDCYDQNLHRFDADKHLFIIDEEIPWSDRLAS